MTSKFSENFDTSSIGEGLPVVTDMAETAQKYAL